MKQTKIYATESDCCCLLCSLASGCSDGNIGFIDEIELERQWETYLKMEALEAPSALYEVFPEVL